MPDTSLLVAALQNAQTVCNNTLLVNPSANQQAKAYLIFISDKLGLLIQDAYYAQMISDSGTFISGPPGSPYDN